MADTTNPDDLAADLIRRTEAMKSARMLYDYMWQEVRDNIIPVMQRFIGVDPIGMKSNQFTVDETPEQANELLAAAVHGMIANPALRNYEYGLLNRALEAKERVAQWLYAAREIAYDWEYRPEAGLAAADHEAFLDACTFGTGALFTADRPGQGLLYQARSLTEIYIDEGPSRQVDTVHRWFKYSARQAVAEFGANKVPKAVADKASDAARQDDEAEYLHAIYPRTDRATGSQGPARAAFESVYVAVESKQIVRRGGFWENPMAVSRWTKRNNEKYGRGCGTKALPSSKALQRAMKITLSGGELAIQPPVQVADDGVIGDVRLHAGGETIVRADMMVQGRDGVRPIQVGARPDLGEEMMKGMRQRIEASFYNHLLSMARDPRMTATQVIQIAEETLRVMAPMLGRLNNEHVGPRGLRTFWILLRAGAFPPLPPELHGVSLKQQLVIRFTGPTALAQKLAEAKGAVQTFGIVAQVAQVHPDAVDVVDWDEAIRLVAIGLGTPKHLLRDPDAIAAARQQRAQAQATTQALANMRQAAGGIKDAATALPAIRQGLGLAPDQAEAGGARCRFSDLAPHLKLRFFQAQAYKRTFGSPRTTRCLATSTASAGSTASSWSREMRLRPPTTSACAAWACASRASWASARPRCRGWLAEHDPKGANRYEGKA